MDSESAIESSDDEELNQNLPQAIHTAEKAPIISKNKMKK